MNFSDPDLKAEGTGPLGKQILAPAETPSELPLDKLPRPADWAQVFGRVAPLVIEIGCGAGRTLINLATQRPERNYLGLERAGEYYRELRARIDKRQWTHVKVARIDAAFVLEHFCGDACVSEYHIYFPDPWPKKRHHKRRLFTPEFCRDLKRTLAPGGVVYFATDHHDYYLELLPRLREALTVREHPEAWPDAPLGRTNFEVKYIQAGRPIYRLVATP